MDYEKYRFLILALLIQLGNLTSFILYLDIVKEKAVKKLSIESVEVEKRATKYKQNSIGLLTIELPYKFCYNISKG